MSDETPFDDVLAEALQARAAEVSASPSDEARRGVDERIRHRVRLRRQRRVVASVVSAVAAVAVVVGAVALIGEDDSSDLAIENDDTTTSTTLAPPVLQPDDEGDDPVAFGLPRLGFSEASQLRPQNVAPGVVQTQLIDRSSAPYSQIQTFRRPGEAVPVIFAPWPAAATEPRPDGTAVRIGDRDGTLAGQEPGWLHLAWTWPDGSAAVVFAYGVASGELVAFAEDLRVRPDGVGYESGSLPDGWGSETTVAPPPGALEAVYELAFRSADARLSVSLTVRTDSRQQQQERLITSLMAGNTGESLRVMGKPGVLLAYPDGMWMVAWAPEEGVTALLIVAGGATRDEVVQLVDGLRRLSADQWNATLAPS